MLDGSNKVSWHADEEKYTSFGNINHSPYMIGYHNLDVIPGNKMFAFTTIYMADMEQCAAIDIYLLDMFLLSQNVLPV